MSGTCSSCGIEIADNSPSGLCDTCLVTVINSSGTPTQAPASPATIFPPPVNTGDRVGRYKLLELIGEGGCGVVYVAEQEQPVHRRVALKLIKPGMDSRQVLARFEAERQALALMNHPNIARVFDAGSTDTGHPFFVMELVKGVPVTRYCDENKLDTHSRLQLFLQICHAVHHAHQKGIIHRDIKPSNILVADHDGAPVPKVIDFGIAKATTDQPLTDRTIYTAIEQFIGTPAYMSPEQAKLSGLDLDTRSDIYSLGVLLYELLTGSTPFENQRLVQAGLDEIRRIIREEDPPRPSTRLNTLGAADLGTVADCRHTEASRLNGLIRGDLDWIVMKTLEKDRNRRYETAIGLALDVQRHLNNEPVVARPPSQMYRLQKLVKRNRTALIAAGAVTAVVAIAAFVSLAFLRRAKAAETARTRLQLETELDKLQNLEKEGQTLQEQGKAEAAEQVFRNVMAGRKKWQADDPLLMVRSLESLTGALEAQRKFAEAEPLRRQTISILKRTSGERDLSVASALHGLGWNLYSQSRRLADAEAAQREALSIQTEALGRESPAYAWTLRALVWVLRDRGLALDAEEMQRDLIALTKKLKGKDGPNEGEALLTLAGILEKEEKFDEAQEAYREAIAFRKKAIGNNKPEVADLLISLGSLQSKAMKFAEAETSFREALAILAKTKSPSDRLVLGARMQLAAALRESGKLDDALAIYRECLKLARGIRPSDEAEVQNMLWGLTFTLVHNRLFSEAEPLARELLEHETTNAAPRGWSRYHAGDLLGTCLVAASKYSEAEPVLVEAYKGMKQHRASPERIKEVSDQLTALYQATGRSNEVMSLMQLLDETASPHAPSTAGMASTQAVAQVSPLDRDELLRHKGQIIRAKGRIVVLGPPNPRTVFYLNFAEKYESGLALVLFRRDNTNEFRQDKLQRYVGKTVQVEGELTEYNQNPQIVIHSLAEIKILDGAAPSSK